MANRNVPGLLIADAWVEVSIQQVRHQIRQGKGEHRDQGDGLDQGQVSPVDGKHQQSA
ncbi:MAG: hypothetical protein H6Q38_128 [Chloroflexi bacterium]|nr:hypothetical protein [Chloroflexota bacterium]